MVLVAARRPVAGVVAVLAFAISPLGSIFGVIWMIFRVLVGGGGSEYPDSVFVCSCPSSSDCASGLGEGAIAGGGRVKEEALSLGGN